MVKTTGKERTVGRANKAGKSSSRATDSSVAKEKRSRKEVLQAEGRTTKNHEILLKTADLISMIAKHNKIKVGEVVDNAVQLLAKQCNIIESIQEQPTILSISKECSRLKSTMYNLTKGMIIRSIGQKESNRLVKHIKSSATNGLDVHAEDYFNNISVQFEFDCNYNEYLALLDVINIQSKDNK